MSGCARTTSSSATSLRSAISGRTARTPKLCMRVSASTRWTTPVDNRTCRIIGWRHFHPDGDPGNNAEESQMRPRVASTSSARSGVSAAMRTRQRIPGDFDAQTSQRPIAVHALEHMTATDKGVLMLRKLLRGPRSGGSRRGAIRRRRDFRVGRPDSDLLPRHGGPHPGWIRQWRGRYAAAAHRREDHRHQSRRRSIRTPPTATPGSVG